MSKVSKLIIIDDKGKYLLLQRGNHPQFPGDPDLPGGTVEDGEASLEAMVREVDEEAGIVVDGAKVRQLYQGMDYSRHGTHYTLYITQLSSRPSVRISWEHASYDWLSRAEFLEKARKATDTYMQMVYEVCIMTDKIKE